MIKKIINKGPSGPKDKIMRTPKANRRIYKNRVYTFSPIRDCWKIYHQLETSFMLMDFETEKELKTWIDKKDNK